MGKVSRSNSNDGEDNTSTAVASPISTPLLPATLSSSPCGTGSRQQSLELSRSIDLDAVLATLGIENGSKDVTNEPTLTSSDQKGSSESVSEAMTLSPEVTASSSPSFSTSIPPPLPLLSSPSAPSNHDKLRILVVDDSLLNRKVMMRCLTATGKECLEADDGDKAVERIRLASINGERIDVVLLDNVRLSISHSPILY